MNTDQVLDALVTAWRLNRQKLRVEAARSDLGNASAELEWAPTEGELGRRIGEAFEQINNGQSGLPTLKEMAEKEEEVRAGLDVLTDGEIQSLIEEAETSKQRKAIEHELQRRGVF